MEAAGRDKHPSLARLVTWSQDYNFFQALRLLRSKWQDSAGGRKIKFSGSNSLAMRPNFIQSIDFSPATESTLDEVAKITVNGSQLSGLHSPLPDAFLEEVYRAAQRGNESPRNFLDMFNQRFLELLYQFKSSFDPMLFDGSVADEQIFSIFRAASGIWEDEQVPQDVQEQYGRFWRRNPLLIGNRRKGYAATKQLLADALDLDVEVTPLTGQWISTPASLHARLDGETRLGCGKSLGGRYWSASAGLTCEVYAKDLCRYNELLPGGSETQALRSLILLVTDPVPTVTIRVLLPKSKLHQHKLGGGVILSSSLLGSAGDLEPSFISRSFVVRRHVSQRPFGGLQ